MGLFTLRVGHPAADHRLARRQVAVARGVRRHPRRAAGRVLHRHPGDVGVGRHRLRRPRSQLGARRARPTAQRPPKNVKRRLADFRAGVYMRTLLRDPAAGLMHSLIYFGFLVLLGVTTVLEIDHQMPESAQVPARQDATRRTRSFGDLAGAGVHGRHRLGDRAPLRAASVPHPHQDQARARGDPRHVPRDRRHRASSPRRSASPRSSQPSYEKWSFIGYPLSHAVRRHRRSTPSTRWHQIMWIAPRRRLRRVPRASCPITMLRHMFTSPLNMYLRDRDRPKGAMKPMPNLTETVARDVRRLGRRGLHVEAAARHRRLHDVRPLHQRVPGPRHRQAARPARDRAQDRRGHGRHRRRTVASARRSASTREITDRRRTRCSSGSPPKRSGRARRCKACDEICPVNIEILDKILDMRRYLSLMESQLPDRARQRLPGDGEPGQPVGHEPGRARRLGQATSTASTIVDPRRAARPPSTSTGSAAPARSTTRTRRSPRRWPSCCSGPASTSPSSGRREMCTGDPARRSGNEYLFQMLAMPNIEMLNGMGVKKIITQCPHCFNTLKNEYPQLGGNYEVVHHSQLLESLIDDGQLDVSAGHARGADHVPRLVLPRPPQRRVPGAAQGRRLDQGHRDRRDAAQRHQGHVLRRRRGAHVDGGVHRHEGQRRAGPGGARPPAPPGSPPPARSATSCSTTA